jgi:hypothetical protein
VAQVFWGRSALRIILDIGCKMGRGIPRVKTGKLPAGNFQDYSMKSTNPESYPQGVLSLLIHCVIDRHAV